jgi:hypothetical protein
VTPSESIELLAFTLSLLLLLSKSFVAGRVGQNRKQYPGRYPLTRNERQCANLLILGHWLELDHFVCVHSATSRTAAVEILFDMMPTKPANLPKNNAQPASADWTQART